jgi:hypothetical protein
MPLLPGRRRKGRGDDESVDQAAFDEPAENEFEDEADDVQPDEPAGDVATAARRRPLDETEAGEETTFPRLDLGSLRIPVFADMEVRVELNEQQQPVAATLLHQGSAVQLLAFAAPRNAGIWDDVRGEIAESVRGDGGVAEEAEGVFGPELRVRLTAQAQPGQAAEQRLRFVGFDGPRWFVRGVFSGPAATNPQQAAGLEAVLTSVVVVRGEDPMAPRDALPLRLPTDVAGIPQAPGQPAPPSFDPMTRGPEITETR